MRFAAFALVSVLAMAACSPSAPSGGGNAGGNSGPSNPSGGGAGSFPQASNVAYRQEATISMANQSIPEIIIHDGARTRTEMNGPMGNMISIMNMETREVLRIMHVGGRTMATRMALSEAQPNSPNVDVEAMRQQMQARAHRLGPCSAAGESGTEWTIDPPAGVTSAHQMSMCMTGDGIMIQMKQDGNVMFDTQRLQRGPQDANLFELPPGVQVTNVRMPSQSSVADAMARARAAAAAAQGTP